MRNNKCLLLHNKNTPVLSSSSSRTGPRQRIDANLVLTFLFEMFLNRIIKKKGATLSTLFCKTI